MPVASPSSSLVGWRPSFADSSRLRLGDAVVRVDHVHRQPHRAPLVGERARDGVADPPRRVGREAIAATVVVALDRLDEADVALLDQVGERHAAVVEAARDRDHQAQVRLDELVLARACARA